MNYPPSLYPSILFYFNPFHSIPFIQFFHPLHADSSQSIIDAYLSLLLLLLLISALSVSQSYTSLHLIVIIKIIIKKMIMIFTNALSYYSLTT